MSIAVQDVFGIVGTVMVIISYLMLQLGRISSQDLMYSLLNAAGAAMILYSLYYNFNLAAAIIEGFWILISMVGIWRYMRVRRMTSHIQGPASPGEDHGGS